MGAPVRAPGAGFGPVQDLSPAGQETLVKYGFSAPTLP
jgi:hypothetical protein